MADAAAPEGVAVGRVLGGRYRIEGLLGAGAMGLVYLARQLSVDREVVIKTLRVSPTAPELKALLAKRLKVEAFATARLDHPSTVRLLDFGEDDDGTAYIVLERLHGRHLGQVLQDRGALAPDAVARIGAQVCASLAEAHAAGVIHRDLKPDNIFLCDYPDEPGVVKVMDFGVARLLPHTDSHVSRITAAGLTVGTPMYIAPEQARGVETTAATDLYSLGVVLFELLTCEPPFSGGSGMELAIKHIKAPPPPLALSGVPPALAGAWEGLITALLEKDPRRRPQHAADVRRRLLALGGLGEAATAPTPTAPPAIAARPPEPDDARAPRGPARVPLLALTAAMALLVGVVLGRLLA